MLDLLDAVHDVVTSGKSAWRLVALVYLIAFAALLIWVFFIR